MNSDRVISVKIDSCTLTSIIVSESTATEVRRAYLSLVSYNIFANAILTLSHDQLPILHYPVYAGVFLIMLA